MRTAEFSTVSMLDDDVAGEQAVTRRACEHAADRIDSRVRVAASEQPQPRDHVVDGDQAVAVAVKKRRVAAQGGSFIRRRLVCGCHERRSLIGCGVRVSYRFPIVIYPNGPPRCPWLKAPGLAPT